MRTSRATHVVTISAATGLILTCGSLTTARADAAIVPTRGAAAHVVAADVVVVLEPGADAVKARAAAVAAGGKIGHTYTAALTGFSASLPPTALAAVRAAAGVAYVEPDSVVRAGGPPPRDSGGVQPDPTWGLDRIDQRDLPLDETYRWRHSGLGATAYVIDSGIRFTHTEFQGRAVSGPDFVDDDDDATDCNGHGTHTAGTVGGETYGVAKDVTMVGIRVIDCTGTGVLSDVLAAIDWVVADADEPSVVNLSLQLGQSQAVDDAIADAFDDSILVVAAAHSAGEDACDQSPGREPTAVTVAASTMSDAAASFSSAGPCVDLYAPGVNIVSAGITSDSATVSYSGTAMSASHVTGGIALLLERLPHASAHKITKVLLRKTSKDKIINPPPGTPNQLLFTRRF